MFSLAFQRGWRCVGREGGAVEFAQGGEPLAVMLPEVKKDRLVGVEPEELSDDLDGEELGVGERRSGSAPSEASELCDRCESSMRQKTATTKVLRSTREDLLYVGWFGRYRA